MANKGNMTLRIEPELKAQAAELFKSLGLDLKRRLTGIFTARLFKIPWFAVRGKVEQMRKPMLQWRWQRMTRIWKGRLTVCRS